MRFTTDTMIFRGDTKGLNVKDNKTKLFMEAHPLNASNYGLTPDQIYLKAMKAVYRYSQHSGKTYFAVDDGCVIIPDDLSYKRFISNTWYE